MSKRSFKVLEVTKPGQSNSKTSSPNKLFHGSSPASAARKAMTHICKTKKIKGRCTLGLKLKEVRSHVKNGAKCVSPVLTKSNQEKTFKYKAMNPKTTTTVTFGKGRTAQKVTFKSAPILKSM